MLGVFGNFSWSVKLIVAWITSLFGLFGHYKKRDPRRIPFLK
jgi:hypothetical protein